MVTQKQRFAIVDKRAPAIATCAPVIATLFLTLLRNVFLIHLHLHLHPQIDKIFEVGLRLGDYRLISPGLTYHQAGQCWVMLRERRTSTWVR